MQVMDFEQVENVGKVDKVSQINDLQNFSERKKREPATSLNVLSENDKKLLLNAQVKEEVEPSRYDELIEKMKELEQNYQKMQEQNYLLCQEMDILELNCGKILNGYESKITKWDVNENLKLTEDEYKERSATFGCTCLGEQQKEKWDEPRYRVCELENAMEEMLKQKDLKKDNMEKRNVSADLEMEIRELKNELEYKQDILLQRRKQKKLLRRSIRKMQSKLAFC